MASFTTDTTDQPTTPTEPSTPSTPSTPATKAVLSPQKLTVDGRDIDCEKYNINDSNYFKLRDLAQVLNGTDSQFAVGYDDATSTVTITTGETYVSTGTELVTGVDNSATAQPSNQTILINGVEHSELTVYNIGGSNFFQLRELGSVLSFEVGYDVDTNTAIVQGNNTSIQNAKDNEQQTKLTEQEQDRQKLIEQLRQEGHTTIANLLGAVHIRQDMIK